MGHRRAVLLILLLPALALAATQGPPAYVYTGAAPSGACTGTRVWIDALGTGTYYCNAGTWAAASAGGGAPTTAQYWTGAADGGLSAEKNLGVLATGLVLNTGGTPSAYTGTTCTLPNVVTALSASGAATCQTPSGVNAVSLTGVATYGLDCTGSEGYVKADGATGVLVCNNGSHTWDKIASVTSADGLVGILAVDKGGTGRNSNWTQYGLVYGQTTTLTGQLGLGTTTQVLHGNASGAPTWGAVDLVNDTSASALPATKGGTGQATTTQGGVLYGGATNTAAWSGAGSAGQHLMSNGTGAPTWTSFPWMTRLTATWASAAVANQTGIIGAGGVPMTSPTYAAGAPFSFRCVISTTRQATTNGPRYGVAASAGSITRISFTTQVGLAATTRTETKLVAAMTTNCAANCSTALGTTVAQVMDDFIDGTGVMNAQGTISLYMAPQAAAAVTAQIGSYCLWY